MIARVWSGWSTPGRADGYVRHLQSNVFPELAGIDGHKGAYVFRRESGGESVGESVGESMCECESVDEWASG